MPERSGLGRVLITGGTGFIGRHLARHLAATGCRPVLTVRSDAMRRRLDAFQEDVDFVDADLLRPDDAARVVSQVRPDTLFHLAGVRSPDPVLCAELNVAATVRILRAATRAGVAKVVILGSAEEYGNQSGPLHEDLTLQPETPYGVTKAAATRLAQAMATSEGCPVVVLRPFTVYGQDQPAHMFVADAVRCAVAREPFRMTPGLQRRDLISVLDVVQALLAAAMRDGLHGEVINVGSGEARRLREVAELIWQVSGTDAPLEIGARPAPDTELRDTWADTRKSRELLGWEARIDLASGLRWCLEDALSKVTVGRS